MTDEPDERAERGVRVLPRRPPALLGWRAPDVVRRPVRRRRRRRWWAAGTAVVVAAAVASAVALTGGGSGPHRNVAAPPRVAARVDGAVQLVADTRATSADPAAASAVVRAEQALSVALLRQLGGSANSAVSPLSLYVALGMLQNGAAGATATQIAHALQAGGLSSAELDAGLATLTADLDAAAAKDGLTLQSANSLWQQRGFPVRPTFLADLATYFKTGVWQADFAHDVPAALRAINAWTAQQTHGKITKLFDQLDPMTVLVLANAIYFHAAWQVPFDPHETEPGAFTTAAGKQVTVKYMSGGTAHAAVGPGYQAAELPYRGGRFAALAIMPTDGSLAGFVRTLTPATLGAITGRLSQGSAVLLPRFTTTATNDLVPVLQALGMRDAFTDDADFSALSAQATQVDQVIQRVYLGVGEKGTTAAAATGIGLEVTGRLSPQQLLVFDRPFLFLVRDTTTGAILFAAQVADPS